jgi:hypothetical protein
MAVDHLFDIEPFVPGKDNELGRLAADLVIFVAREAADYLSAGRLQALAHVLPGLVAGPEFTELVDALVDLAKQPLAKRSERAPIITFMPRAWKVRFDSVQHSRPPPSAF